MTNVSNYAIAAILCLQTICYSVISTLGQYIYASYLETYPFPLNITQNLTTNVIPSFYLLKTVSDGSKQCVYNTINLSNSNVEVWAQEQSADLFFRIGLWNSCPLIIMTYILGVYTPKLGRRFVLIVPMIGTLGQLSIWLAIIYFHLADYWWYIASFIVGLSGSNYIFNFVLSLIITDNTTENERSTRFVLFEAMTTTVSAIVTFGIGYYINWRGFTDLYWISLGLEILAIIIVIVFIKKTNHLNNERTPLLSSSSSTENNIDVQIKESSPVKTKCSNCFVIFRIFSFKNRSHRKSISLLLTLFAYIFYLLAYSTYAAFLWYLLDAPFCWSSENVGNYTALTSISSAIFSIIGMKFFIRIGANDTIICAFSHLCFAASSLWIAFAKHSWQLYAGLVITPYADYQNSLTLSMMSKWLAPHERNHAFTLVAEVNTIVTTFGDSIFNWIYAQTVANFSNFTLLIAAGLSIIGFILNICLFGVTRRMSQEVLPSVSESEPLFLPTNDISHAVDIICPASSSLHSICLPPSSIKNISRMNSLDDKTIITNDLVVF